MKIFFQRLFKENYLIFLIVAATVVLSFNINKPFIGHHDFMSGFEGMMAKNYLEHGVLELKFGQVTSHIFDENRSYQLSYLPLLALSLFMSFAVFGVSEWAARLPMILYSVVGLIFFYLVVKKIWNEKVALLSSIFYIFNPLFVYFGKLTIPDVPVMTCVLIAFYLYLKWIEKPTIKLIISIAIAIFIGGLFGWPVVYIAPLICLHSFLIKKFKPKLLFINLVLLIIPLLQFIHAYILTGELSQQLLRTLKMRFAQKDLNFGGQDFSTLSFIKQEFLWVRVYFTNTLFILVFLNLLVTLRDIYQKKFNLQNATVITFLLFGLSHLVLFSRYAFIHDFLIIYLLPFFALSGGIILYKLLVNLRTKYELPIAVISFICLMIILVFVFERIEYTKTLFNTSMNRPGYEMGQLLNTLQNNHNQVAIVSPRFNEFYGFITQFYSNYGFSVVAEESLKEKSILTRYKYVIFIDEDIRDRKQYDEFINIYKFDRRNDWTIVNLKSN